MKRKLTALLLTALLLVTLVSCDNTAVTTSPPASPAPPVSSAPSPLPTLSEEPSTPPDTEIVIVNYTTWAEKKEGEFDFSAMIPKLESAEFPENAALINDYFQQNLDKEREVFYEYLKDYEEGYSPWEFVLDYYVEYNHGGILSILFNQYWYLGGAHGGTILYADTVDVTRGVRLMLEDVFKVGEEVYMEKILDYIIAEMDKEHDMYFGDYAELARATFNNMNFVLTDEGLTFFYQEYDVAPYVAGMPTFVIPYSEFSGMLADWVVTG